MPYKSTEAKRAAQKRYYEKNKKKILEYSSEWAHKNRERCNENRRRRRVEDPAKYEEEKKKNGERIKLKKREVNKKLCEHYGGACKICGLEDDPCVYDFHHLDPNKKDMEMSRMVTRFYTHWDKLVAEADKCVMVCSNCHRKVHRGLVDLNDFTEKPLDNLWVLM